LSAGLGLVAREARSRIIAALAARYRDLDLAEECFSEACARAVKAWSGVGMPANPAGWLYRTAERCALDLLRKRRVREKLTPDCAAAEQSIEEAMIEELDGIPDERLRLIFVCCHPAVASDARAALTLRLVCGLSTLEIARAFLMPEATLAQRLVRAKRKIAEAGVPFEIPPPQAWAVRLEAVLCTLEIAYAKAHEDAAGSGAHAGYADEMLGLTRVLADLIPREPEVLALAALVRFAEARRPARLGAEGIMIPLAEQDPALWRREMIEEGQRYLARAWALGRPVPRFWQAALHGTWCARRSLDDPPPWAGVLLLYDRLLTERDDVVVRLNRAVALSEVEGPCAALAEVEGLEPRGLAQFLPYHALRADLLARVGRRLEACDAYEAALALAPTIAERRWLERRHIALRAV
jgi:RNA polymerase sigma-70 factor (ECF subfamily)